MNTSTEEKKCKLTDLAFLTYRVLILEINICIKEIDLLTFEEKELSDQYKRNLSQSSKCKEAVKAKLQTRKLELEKWVSETAKNYAIDKARLIIDENTMCVLEVPISETAKAAEK